MQVLTIEVLYRRIQHIMSGGAKESPRILFRIRGETQRAESGGSQPSPHLSGGTLLAPLVGSGAESRSL